MFKNFLKKISSESIILFGKLEMLKIWWHFDPLVWATVNPTFSLTKVLRVKQGKISGRESIREPCIRACPYTQTWGYKTKPLRGENLCFAVVEGVFKSKITNAMWKLDLKKGALFCFYLSRTLCMWSTLNSYRCTKT